MKAELKPGIEHQFTFRVSESKTVAALYPEATEFQVMPVVLATGFMVGLFEWTCIQALGPYLDGPAEQTVGTHINVSHVAATPVGFEVRVHVKLVEVDRRRLVFTIDAHDDAGLISQGTHERFIIDKAKFDANLKRKCESHGH